MPTDHRAPASESPGKQETCIHCLHRVHTSMCQEPVVVEFDGDYVACGCPPGWQSNQPKIRAKQETPFECTTYGCKDPDECPHWLD